MNDNPPELSLLETRILGTLVEKQRTVPDTYPLSVNALQAGCNQKTSRNPVMETTEAEILVALDDLKEKGWVREVSGSRVSRFEHQVEKELGVPTQASALLTVLMLRLNALTIKESNVTIFLVQFLGLYLVPFQYSSPLLSVENSYKVL